MANDMFMNLLAQLMGGSGSTDTNSTQDTTNVGSTVQDQTQNQTSSGSTNTSGSSTSNTTQNQMGSSTTSTNADIAALRSVFEKQSAGISPEMLSAIFTEGSKKIPQLQTSYANAVGARASENTPLATSLTGLQSSLVNQAATLNNQLLSDSSATAARIADLTKSQTTTSNQSSTGNTDTVSQQQQLTQQLLNTILNSTTDTASSGTTDTSSNVRNKQSMNPDMLKLIGGGGLGISLLDSLMGGNGTTGGVNDILAAITGRGGSGAPLGGGIGDILKKLIGGGGFNWGDVGGGTFTPDLPDLSNVGTDIGGLLDGLDFGDFGDIFGEFGGFADGGVVNKAQARLPGLSAGGGGNAQERLAAILAAMAPEPAPAPAPVASPTAKAPTAPSRSQAKSAPAPAPKEGVKGPLGSRGDYQDDLRKYIAANPLVGTTEANTRAAVDNMLVGYQDSGYAPDKEALFASMYDSAAASKEKATSSEQQLSDWKNTLTPEARAHYDALVNANYAAKSKAHQMAFIGLVTGLGAAGMGLGAGGGLGEMLGLGKDAGQVLGAVSKIPGAAKTNNADPSGHADGRVPGNKKEDPNGIEDTVDAKLSVGEVVIPTDVVDQLGSDFFTALIDRYHTPVAIQRAMGA